jgi:hypothetical protein
MRDRTDETDVTKAGKSEKWKVKWEKAGGKRRRDEGERGICWWGWEKKGKNVWHLVYCK